jgi:hypothetical protein
MDDGKTFRMELSEQERQLIECLREQESTDEFGVTVKLGGGAWEVDMSAGQIKGRGVGRTFDAAWDNVTGLKF